MSDSNGTFKNPLNKNSFPSFSSRLIPQPQTSMYYFGMRDFSESEGGFKNNVSSSINWNEYYLDPRNKESLLVNPKSK